MLKELRIENFAIIDRLELEFAPGLIIFTGETGAGKSIIIDAVELLLGGRSSPTLVRSGNERAYVEGVFRIPSSARAALHGILEREDLLDNPEEVTLAREIRHNGRNIARLNGRSVNSGLLEEIGEYLVDIHGQSEHLSLLRVKHHLRLLDSFANLDDLFSQYSQSFRLLQQVRRELNDLHRAESDAARRLDMLSYQINEIEAAQLSPGEDEQLLEERNRLANAEGLASLAQEALLLMDEGQPEAPSISDLIGQVVHALNGLARLDPSQSILSEQAQEAFESLADLNRSLRLYQEGIEFNPKRLDQVEDRLGLIQNLKRKYGSTIPEIIQFASEAQRQMDTITHAGERIQELEVEESDLLVQLSEGGMALSKERHAAAEELSRAIESELSDLSMEGARFKVDFHEKPDPTGVPVDSGRRVAFDASGLEQVEFLVAPNPGEGLKPLVKIASGGETSRLMLALKNVLARADQVPTLIFDEIDQGIGGRVGAVVGRKLWSLARQHQVVCITHLPQLAAFGEQHYLVKKHVRAGRTRTIVETLDGEARLQELAQMMGEISIGTRRSAEELLQAVDQITSK